MLDQTSHHLCLERPETVRALRERADRIRSAATSAPVHEVVHV
ncbi:hypothetical protein [Kitasatospora purpeofusca]